MNDSCINEKLEELSSYIDDKDDTEFKVLIPWKKSKKSKLNFKDILLKNDLDLFYTKGIFPIIFFTHLLSTLIITFLLIKEVKNKNNLMQQTRAVQASFYFHEDTSNPTGDYPRNYYFSTFESLSNHIQKTIETIYNINKTLDFNVFFINYNNLEIRANYKKSSRTRDMKISDFPYSFKISNSIQDPISEFYNKSITKIRKFLSMTDSLFISLEYEYNRLNYDTCQLVNLQLYYDTSRISYIKYTPNFNFKNCILNKNPLKINLLETTSLFCIFLIVFSSFEVYLIFNNILKIINIVYFLKENLSNTDLFEDFTNEDIFLRTGKSKWDLVAKKDLFSLFPIWLIVLLMTSIINCIGGIFFLFNPFLNNVNQILFGFGVFFSWVSFAYYFKSSPQYFLFYSTLSKSMKEYKFLFITFALLFSGFCLLNLSIFCYNDKYYDGFQGTFKTIFAATLGDILIDIWSSTFKRNPLVTLFIGFIMFLIFLGNHIRVMFTITQESFQLANLENKKSWLEKQFDFEDYLNQQFNLNQKGEEEKNKSGSENSNHFVLDDAWMRAMLGKDNEYKLDNIDLNNLKLKGLNIEAVVKYLKRLRKKNEKKKISKEILNEILNEAGNTNNRILANKHLQIENAFSNLHLMLNKLHLFVCEPTINITDFKNINKICKDNLEEIRIIIENIESQNIYSKIAKSNVID